MTTAFVKKISKFKKRLGQSQHFSIFFILFLASTLIVSPISYLMIDSGSFTYPEHDINNEIEGQRFSSLVRFFQEIYGKNVLVFGDQSDIGGIEYSNYRIKIMYDNYPYNLNEQKIAIIQLTNIKFKSEGDTKFFDFIASPWNKSIFDSGKYQIPIRLIVESINNNQLIIGPVLFQSTTKQVDDLSENVVNNFNADVAGKNFTVFNELLLSSRANISTWKRAIRASLSIMIPGYQYEVRPNTDFARFFLVTQKISMYLIYFLIGPIFGFLVVDRLKKIRSKTYSTR